MAKFVARMEQFRLEVVSADHVLSGPAIEVAAACLAHHEHQALACVDIDLFWLEARLR